MISAVSIAIAALRKSAEILALLPVTVAAGIGAALGLLMLSLRE